MSQFRHGRALVAVLAALLLMTTVAASASAAVQPPPGGPILLVTANGDPFGSYDAEILRNEGFNDFAVVDVSAMEAQLAGHDTVVLARAALTDAQVTALTNWVNAGGNLIAMRPDKKLAGLLGLSDADDTIANGNLQIDTTQAPGAGLTASPMQFHGVADLYTLAGARSVATLSPGSNPAVSLRNVGAGHAAAFTYDLARSVVFTRQGNPNWRGQNRDRDIVGANPDPVVRSDDLFFGAATGDVQPDWVDLTKVEIPQADEQQRLLANLVVQLSVTPTPRFWYFPRGDKAVLALTGDDHGSGGTEKVFQQMFAAGSAECRVDAPSQALLDSWTCPRSTSYVYPDNSILDKDFAAAWSRWGFEMSPHPMFQSDGSCLDFTPATLKATLDAELAAFKSKFPGVPDPTTIRTHCISWSDWSSQPKEDLAHGIRLNTDYYYFPGQWTLDRPGMFTGSGMPMRFADCDGSLIDVYQAATYTADDATLGNPNTVVEASGKALMQNALGAKGYYGAFTVQVHTDYPDAASRNALIQYAQQNGVPMVSERQLLRWLDARNASSFKNISYAADGTLTFTVEQAAGADGLWAMIPAQGLTALKHNGQTTAIQTQTIKGVSYAILPDASGAYEAKYSTGPGAAHVASSFTGSLPSGAGGSGACEDPGNPGPIPGGNPGGGNPGGGNPGGGSTGGGSTGGSTSGGSTGTTRVITEAGPVQVASTKPTKALAFVSASGSKFRPGSKRTFVLTVRLGKTARVVVTFRDKAGKVVRRIRVAKHKAGSTVRVRWNGKDARGRYVAAGTYGYTVTAVGTGYLRTARGSVAVLTAR